MDDVIRYPLSSDSNLRLRRHFLLQTAAWLRRVTEETTTRFANIQLVPSVIPGFGLLSRVGTRRAPAAPPTRWVR